MMSRRSRWSPTAMFVSVIVVSITTVGDRLKTRSGSQGYRHQCFLNNFMGEEIEPQIPNLAWEAPP